MESVLWLRIGLWIYRQSVSSRKQRSSSRPATSDRADHVQITQQRGGERATADNMTRTDLADPPVRAWHWEGNAQAALLEPVSWLIDRPLLVDHLRDHLGAMSHSCITAILERCPVTIVQRCSRAGGLDSARVGGAAYGFTYERNPADTPIHHHRR